MLERTALLSSVQKRREDNNSSLHLATKEHKLPCMAKNFGFCLNPRFGQIIVIALLSRSHPVFCSLYMGKSLALFPGLLTLCFWYVVSIIHRSGRSSGKKKQGRVVKYGALYNCYTTTAILFFFAALPLPLNANRKQKMGNEAKDNLGMSLLQRYMSLVGLYAHNLED